MMKQHLAKKNAKVVAAYRLQGLNAPVDLNGMARKWGVTSVEERQISSDAMLLPSLNGYSIILKPVSTPSGHVRQRFSFAHELGHLMLRELMLSARQNADIDHRLPYHLQDEEERLCDHIASEILMPRISFEEDSWLGGWTLENVPRLAGQYEVSVATAARRMVELMPEPCVVAAWKLSENIADRPLLQWSYSSEFRYSVSRRITASEKDLVQLALNSDQVVVGKAYIVDKNLRLSSQHTVGAEAWAWGHAKFRQTMIYYYPKRRSYWV